MRSETIGKLLSLLVVPLITGVSANYIFDRLKGHASEAAKVSASGGAVVAVDGGIAAGRDVHTGVSEEQIEQIITRVLRATPLEDRQRTASRQLSDSEAPSAIVPKFSDAPSKPPAEAKLAALSSLPRSNVAELIGTSNPATFLGNYAAKLLTGSLPAAVGINAGINRNSLSTDTAQPIFGTLNPLTTIGSRLPKPLSTVNNLLQISPPESLTVRVGIDDGVSSIALAGNDVTKLNFGTINALAVTGSDLTKQFAAWQISRPESLTTPIGINGGASPITLTSYDEIKPNFGTVNALAVTGSDFTKQFAAANTAWQISRPESLTTLIGINSGASPITLPSYDAIKPNFGTMNTLPSIGGDPTKSLSPAGNSLQPSQTGILGTINGTSNSVVPFPASPLSIVRPQPL